MNKDTHPHSKFDGGSCLIETIDASPLSDIGKDIGEIALDSLLADGVLKDIPVVGWIAGVANFGRSVRDVMFTKRVLGFLSELSNLSDTERKEGLAKLTKGDKANNVGEAILTALDRGDHRMKAHFLGQLFSFLALEKITEDEFWQIFTVIDRTPYRDLIRLPDEIPNTAQDPQHERLKYIYASAGLGQLLPLIGGTGFRYNERLFAILTELGISQIN